MSSDEVVVGSQNKVELTVVERKTDSVSVIGSSSEVVVQQPKSNSLAVPEPKKIVGSVDIFTGPPGTRGPAGPAGQPGQPGTDGVDGQGIFFSDTPLTGMTQPYLRIGLDETGDYTLFLGVPDA